MGNIFELMVNESRESLFQLECIANSLDNKAYGLIAFNTILLSIFAYFVDAYHNDFMYIPTILIIISLLALLVCIIPRTSHRMTGEIIINRYGEKEFNDAAGCLAFNYASLEKELTDIYNKKMNCATFSLIFTIIGIISGALILAYLTFDS